MCLITDWDKPRIVEEDITCYKWYGMSNSAYISPYQGKPIPSFDTKVYSDLSEPEIINELEELRDRYTKEDFAIRGVIEKIIDIIQSK